MKQARGTIQSFSNQAIPGKAPARTASQTGRISHPFLADAFMPAGLIDSISSRAFTYGKGECIWFASGNAWDVAVLLEGVLQINCVSPEGKQMLVGTLIAPALLDWRVLGRTEMLANSVIAQNPCTLVFGSREWLEAKLIASPTAVMPLLESMIELARQLQKAIILAVTVSILPKIAYAILENANETRGHARLSHQEIADIIGAQRSSVSRALAVLRRLGLVTTKHRLIELRDLPALTALAL